MGDDLFDVDTDNDDGHRGDDDGYVEAGGDDGCKPPLLQRGRATSIKKTIHNYTNTQTQNYTITQMMMVASHLSFKIKGGAPLGGNLLFQSIRPGEQVLKRRRMFLIILRLLDYDQG